VTLALRTRLAAISSILFGTLLAGFSVASYEILARRLDADLSDRLAELTDGLHGYLRVGDGGASVNYDPNDNDQATFVHEATRYYQVYDAETGQELAASDGFAPLGLELTPDEVRAFRAHPESRDMNTEYGRLRISNSVRMGTDGRAYLLQVGVSLASMDAALAHYRESLWWRVTAALAITVFASWWLSAFALRPLSQIAEATREIDVGTLDRRLPVRGTGDELDRVAVAFNDTLGHLEHSVAEMRQFSAALAHELRTPLAVLRGEIELAMRAPDAREAQRTAFASQMEEIDRLTQLIDQILTLARAEAGQIRLTRAPVDLSALAHSLVEQLEPVADARSIALTCEASDAVIVMGDRGWLQRLLLNLLDNALKFTPAHGRVAVRVSRDAQAALIAVRDTGVGLSTDDLARVFQRFFRADPARSTSRPGAGLGLSLVQWIAGQHHGTVKVRSRPGEGSTFTVTLPISHA
jgi:heavy metal sensor kinase